MKLVHLHPWEKENEDRANRFHRIERPCELLTREGRFEAIGLPWNHPDAEAMACAADVLILHLLHDMALEAVIDWRRARGRATLYEIADDLSAPAPWRKFPHRSPLILSECFHLASRCDGVQFSSAALQGKYAIVSQRTQVLPNLVEIPARLSEKPPGFTVGWAGTRSHREDLRLLVPVLRDLLRLNPGIQLALKGDLEMLHDLFDELPSAQVRFEDFGSPASYDAFLQTLHAGIIPLAATAFNAGRTDVKLFEYAAAGVVAILQKSAVYGAHLNHTLWFQDPQALGPMLERLHMDPAAMEVERVRLHAYVLNQGGHASTLERHAAWYLSHAPASMNNSTLPRTNAWANVAMESMQRFEERGPCESGAVAAVLELLESYPGYLRLRMLAVQVLVRAGSLSRALSLARPLLTSVMYRDSAVMIALAEAPPSRRARFRRHLRSAVRRVRSLPFDPDAPLDFARTVLEHAPFDFFSLMVCARSQSSDLSLPDRKEIEQRLALFESAP
ncbi:hypothetical protein SAMN05421771_2092 [Granulicella pectinivorans]|uniref:Glycosyl transferases group 1 n=2 Tax=Granulicella pectinivorans TaxID=474950 RepID=A0A1I6M962_9BACT|nr:hypothetical protein SAMN05421771_2092 [Granulicella pectinivorans]